MDAITYVSFNVNGLGEEVKRNNIFEKLKKIDCIAFLQETHTTKKCEHVWKCSSGGVIMFSHVAQIVQMV